MSFGVHDRGHNMSKPSVLARLLRWVVFGCALSTCVLGSLFMISKQHDISWIVSRKQSLGQCGPRLLVIGTQKGGTTSLYKYLKRFDWIGVGRTKELHFFDKVYKEGRGMSSVKDLRLLQIEYLKNFGMDVVQWPGWTRNISHTCTDHRTKITYCCQNRDKIFADVTPRYMIIPDAPRVAQHITNDPWILALVREPAARAVSHFRMEFRWDDEESHRHNSTLFAEEFHKRVQRAIKISNRCLQYPVTEECLHRGMDHDADFVWRGLYYMHLEPWLRHFDKDKVLIWVSESFSSDPARHLVDLQDTIMGHDKDTSSIFEQDYEKFNVDEKVVQPWNGTMILLKNFYKEHNAKLIEFLSSWGYHSAAQDIERLW